MPLDCRSYMVADKNWKYIYAPGYPPVLFDLKKDPSELNDLGQNSEYKKICEQMFKKLATWSFTGKERLGQKNIIYT